MSQSPSKPQPGATVTALIVATAFFMENMDSSVIATALPSMAADLGEDPLALKLAVTSYLVGLAVFTPVSGWVADRFGSRRTFMTAICVFGLGSLLCAAADSLANFVLWRFLQGMGGAMMVPVGRLVLIRSVPRSGLVAAMNTMTMPVMVAPLIGPAIGGLITMVAGWRWIFLINIPIGMVGLALAAKFIPDFREEDVPRLDWRGFALSGIGLSTLMLGLSTLGRHLLPTSASLALLVVGFVGIAAYVWHAGRTEHPLIDLSLLRLPTFFNGVVAGGLFRVGVGATPFLLPLLFQLGFHMTPLDSGLLVAATAVGVLVTKSTSVPLLRRWGFRRVLMANALLASLVIASSGLFTAATPLAVIFVALFFNGGLRSIQFSCLNSITFAEVPAQRMSNATSFGSMVQRLAMSTGVVIGAFTLQFSGWWHGRDTIETLDFLPAFLVVAAISGASFFSHRHLSTTAGAELSGHRAP